MSEHDGSQAPAADGLARTIPEAETGEEAVSSTDRRAMFNVSLPVQVVIGQTRMTVEDLLDLGRGAVVELDRCMGEPVDVLVNDRLIARGNLVEVGDGDVGVRLTEVTRDPLPEV